MKVFCENERESERLKLKQRQKRSVCVCVCKKAGREGGKKGKEHKSFSKYFYKAQKIF